MKTAEMPVPENFTKPVRKLDPHLHGVIKFICRSLGQSGTRLKLLKLAKRKGYSDKDFNDGFRYVVEMPVSTVAQPQLVDAQSSTAAFDPREAGRRMVEEWKAAEGGAWTGQELHHHYHLSSATLHRRRKEHRIVYWRDAQHNFHYPKWQFNASGASLSGIEAVLKLLQSEDEWRVMRYFLGKRAQLDDLRPLDLLRRGEVKTVLAHVKIHVAENTW